MNTQRQFALLIMRLKATTLRSLAERAVNDDLRLDLIEVADDLDKAAEIIIKETKHGVGTGG